MHPKLKSIVSGAVLLLAASAGSRAGPGPGNVTYRIAGNYVEICGCQRICEGALYGSQGRAPCAFVAALRIEAGQRGDVPLGGLAFAIVSSPTVASPPRAGPGGDGPKPPAVLYVDPRASQPQVEALAAIAHERFGGRLAAPLGPPRPAAIAIERSTDLVGITIDGVADVRGRPLLGGFHRLVQLQNGPGMAFPTLFIARGTVGQVVDASVGVRIEAEGKSVLYGQFDVSNAPARRKT